MNTVLIIEEHWQLHKMALFVINGLQIIIINIQMVDLLVIIVEIQIMTNSSGVERHKLPMDGITVKIYKLCQMQSYKLN